MKLNFHVSKQDAEMAGLVYKLEVEIPLKESADKFYKMFKENCSHFPTAPPGMIQNVKVIEGDWDSHGSIRIWNYTVAGKEEVYMERVEFDDENNAATLVGVEGHVFEMYKSFKITNRYIPYGCGGSKARLTIVYEQDAKMAGLVYKLEAEIPLKESADKFYKMFKENCSHFLTAPPGRIQNVKVIEGDWDSHGSIRIWNYTVAGKEEVYMERVEFDDENNAATLVGVEGHVFEMYKSFKITNRYIPYGCGGSKARLTIVYEKLKDDSPHREVYLDLAIGLLDIENHLAKP